VRKKSKEILAGVLRDNSPRAVENFLIDVRSLSPEQLEVFVKPVRTIKHGVGNEARAQGHNSQVDGRPVARILHVLRSQTYLSDVDAVAMLAAILDLSPAMRTASIEDWIDWACKMRPSGEVLGAAMAISKRLRELG
jgi:hypothetical protein